MSLQAQSLWERAVAAAQANDLALCAAWVDQLLDLEPDHGEALRLAGKLALARGDAEGGRHLLERAAALLPAKSGILYEIGVAHLQGGQIDAAGPWFQRQLDATPDHGDSLFNLAWAERRQGRHAQAAATLSRLVALAPGHAQGWYMLGNARMELNRWAEAAEAFERALALEPKFDDARLNLGLAMIRLGAADKAQHCLEGVPPARQTAAEGLTLKAEILLAKGQTESAMAVLSPLHDQMPDQAIPALRLAQLLRGSRRSREAIAVLDRTLAHQPGNAKLLAEAASCTLGMRDAERARLLALKALDAEDGNIIALDVLGRLDAMHGRYAEAEEHFRKAIERAPDLFLIQSNFLFLKLHDDCSTPEEVFAEHQAFGHRIQARYRPLPPAPVAPPAPRIRVGYVSGDLCDHAVAYFLEPWLRGHDRSRFEIFCYHIRRHTDAVTARLRALSDEWRSIDPDLPPERLAEIIRADNIHILFDLSGHTAGNVLPVFALKPAPIQLTGLGYPGSTGMDVFDGRIFIGPSPKRAHEQEFSTEPMVGLQMPFSFRPPPEAPDVAPPPFLRQGFLTFGSVNKFSKVGNRVRRSWCRILAQVPDSRLLILHPFGDEENAAAQVRELFAQDGIDPARIMVAGERPLEQWLALLGQVDIALDPFPYLGGTTTNMCHWMGVPTVSLNPGHTHGLPFVLASDEESYVAAAVTVAADRDRLRQWRAGLRAYLMVQHRLVTKKFVAEIEEYYTRLLGQHDAAEAAESLD